MEAGHRGQAVGGQVLPLPEVAIAGSVVLLGAMVLSGRSISSWVYLAVFAVAGLFHGWAYGESIIGAETAPLLAYMAGFAAIQYLIAIAAGGVVLWIWRATEPAAVRPRLAGAIVAGVGAAFLIENVEVLLFAS